MTREKPSTPLALEARSASPMLEVIDQAKVKLPPLATVSAAFSGSQKSSRVFDGLRTLASVLAPMLTPSTSCSLTVMVTEELTACLLEVRGSLLAVTVNT